MTNIFQGNEQLESLVKEVLGFDKEKKYWLSAKDIYLSTFFYMTKRFGMPDILDEYKDGGTWDFKVKDYIIRVTLNSSWVSFIVFGNIKHHISSPYVVKLIREQHKKKDQIVDMFKNPDDRTKKERALLDSVFDDFCKQEGIDDTWTEERFKEKMSMKWYDYVCLYNNRVLDIDKTSYSTTECYSNSLTRHALKTLRQFINNMLTPIYVRDVAYNIKGQCGDEFDKYIGNIQIKRDESKTT